MARRNSAHGMHKTVRLLATGLAALILCGGMVLLFVTRWLLTRKISVK